MEQLIIGLIFIAALVYLVQLVRKQFQSQGCASGCGKCQAVDFKSIEAKLKQSGKF